ncbi:MAG: hypothetical protein AAGF11_23440 [Myxococcota bacterium]
MPWLPKIPLATLVLTMACQNNTIQLETTPEPDTTGSDSDPSTGFVTGVDSGVTTDSGPVTETMLLAIRTIWSETAFIQGLMTSTQTGNTTDLTLQFLSLDMGSNTSPRMPVGPEYAYPAVPLDPDGGFTLDAGQITIAAEANPINALEINTTLVLVARPAASPWCGEVTGNVTVPVVTQFDGSTHAITTVPSASELPAEFLTGCP